MRFSFLIIRKDIYIKYIDIILKKPRIWLDERKRKDKEKKQNSYKVNLQIKIGNINIETNVEKTELKYKEHITDKYR